MSNKINLYSIILLLMFVATLPNYVIAASKKTKSASDTRKAEEAFSIQPFGKLDWNDGLPQIIKKLNHMDGVESIFLNGISPKAIELKGLVTNEMISNALTGATASNYASGDEVVILVAKTAESDAEKLIDKNANKYLATNYGLDIIARPINIADVPFDVIIELEMTPGLPIINPESLIMDSYGKYGFPYAIRKVNLVTKSNQLINKMNDIKNAISAKYGKSNIVDNVGGFTINSLKDTKLGSTLNVDCNTHLCEIRYLSGSTNSFRTAYKKHLGNLENNATKGKPNMGGEL